MRVPVIEYDREYVRNWLRRASEDEVLDVLRLMREEIDQANRTVEALTRVIGSSA